MKSDIYRGDVHGMPKALRDHGMSNSDSSAGTESAFSWNVYTVSAHNKRPLLQFVPDALASRGCTIVHTGVASRAPFFIIFTLPGGERMSVLIYAFLANARVTRNRPSDEHRFQVKYGGDLSGVIESPSIPMASQPQSFLA